jgi:hypothetical protein
VLWLHLPRNAWLDASPLANGGFAAGTRDLGSSAGSNAAARISDYILCAGSSAAAVDALWPGTRDVH